MAERPPSVEVERTKFKVRRRRGGTLILPWTRNRTKFEIRRKPGGSVMEAWLLGWSQNEKKLEGRRKRGGMIPFGGDGMRQNLRFDRNVAKRSPTMDVESCPVPY